MGVALIDKANHLISQIRIFVTSHFLSLLEKVKNSMVKVLPVFTFTNVKTEKAEGADNADRCHEPHYDDKW